MKVHVPVSNSAELNKKVILGGFERILGGEGFKILPFYFSITHFKPLYTISNLEKAYM